MFFNRSASSPNEVESQDRVFVAPFAGFLTAFGGDKAAAGYASCHILVYIVDKKDAGEGKQGLVEGEGPGSNHHHDEGLWRGDDSLQCSLLYAGTTSSRQQDSRDMTGKLYIHLGYWFE